MRILVLTCCLWGWGILATATAQPFDTIPPLRNASRPRLGLVLSGGAAKGLAHIGVLKVLEEAGIQPDIITGTSMGALLGGLYAIGYRADTLERLALQMDWDRILGDQLDLDEVLFEEKPYFLNEFLEIPLRQGKLKAPSGLVAGQQVSQLLSQLALPAYSIQQFRDYPIPFVCVAVDLVRGEPVLLDRGWLPEALRTSMAIPTLFTAVERDSMVLVDGGLIRNFPVQEAKDMGADLIIGVYTGAQTQSREQLQSFSNILYQTGFMMSIKDAQAQMPWVTIYLEPELQGFGAEDFRNVAAIIGQGELAARQQWDALKALADSLNRLGPPREISPLPPVPALWVDTILVTGQRYVSAGEIIGQTGLKAQQAFSSDQLNHALASLMGTNQFRRVTYTLEEDSTHTQRRLILQSQEKERQLLRVAMRYDSYANAGFLFSYTARNWGGQASRLMAIGRVSTNFRGQVNYLKYLGQSRRKAIFLQAGLLKDFIPITGDGGVVTSQYRLFDFPLEVSIQSRLSTNAQVRLGFQRSQLFFNPLSGDDARLFKTLRYKNYSLFGRVEVNTLDRNVFPRRGTQLWVEGRHLFDNRFRYQPVNDSGDSLVIPTGVHQRVWLDWMTLLPLHSHATVKVGGTAAAIFSAQNNFSDFFLLGAPESVMTRSLVFHGLEANELIVQVALLGRLGYQQFFTRNLNLALDVNAGFLAFPEVGTQATPRPETFVGGIGLTLGYRTIAGPVRFSLMQPIGLGEIVTSHLRTFLSFGYQF